MINGMSFPSGWPFPVARHRRVEQEQQKHRIVLKMVAVVHGRVLGIWNDDDRDRRNQRSEKRLATVHVLIKGDVLIPDSNPICGRK